MSTTRTLAAFAADLEAAAIPPTITERIKLHLLDALGNALAGAATGLIDDLAAVVRAQYAAGPCLVPGRRECFGPLGAALLTSAAINALDHDDGFEIDGKGMGHPGASLIAGALSAVFTRPLSGPALLAALTAAYEINDRVILAMQPSLTRFRLVYGVCQHQALGTAIAYGRLCGLDAPALENALGLAGTLAPVPSLRKYNWDARPLVSFKDFNAPATEAGVKAVLLDQAGLIGALDVLDGDSGFWRMMGSDQWDPAILTRDLGQRWHIPFNSLKPYPACRWIHAALESFETLHRAAPWPAAAIEAIEVRASQTQARDFMDAQPTTMIDGQFSLPYTLACLALGDRPMARWYQPAALNDPARQALARRVSAVIDPVIDQHMSGESRRPAGMVRVKVGGIWHDGPLFTHPLGGAERPLAPAAIIGKFHDNAAVALPSPQTAALAEAILALETVADVGALLRRVLIPTS